MTEPTPTNDSPEQNPQTEPDQTPEVTNPLLSNPTEEPTTEPKLYAGKYETVAELEKAYSEAQKVISSKQEKPKAPANELPKEVQERLAKAEKYEVEERRAAINKELGLDYTAEQWQEVADHAVKVMNSKQLNAIKASLEAGIYSPVKELVEKFNASKTNKTEPGPGNTPKAPATGDESSGFQTAEEAKAFLQKSRGLSRAGSGKQWIDKLENTPSHIRNQLGVYKPNK